MTVSWLFSHDGFIIENLWTPKCLTVFGLPEPRENVQFERLLALRATIHDMAYKCGRLGRVPLSLYGMHDIAKGTGPRIRKHI